jgi:PAS domain S-box-containing protein
MTEITANKSKEVPIPSEELDKFIGAATEALEKKIKELEEARITLEEKVKERTEEIERRSNDLENSRMALMNILEDTEESRRMSEEEKEKTKAIINNFTDGLLVFDEKEELSLINPQAESFFEIKSKELIKKSVLELDVFSTFKPITSFLKGGMVNIFRKEAELREDLVLEVSTVPIKTEEGKLGTLIILHDITRERIIERMKTEFVSISAHQLRTPLSAIKWTLGMLLDGDLGEITKDQKEFLFKTYASNERMINLINDLLDVSRIEEGRYLYKPTLNELEPIIQFIVNSCKEQLEKKRIILEIKKPAKKLPKIMVDVEKIKLAIQNFIDNAIKYTLDGGRVEISFSSDENNVEVSVKDSGIGIPKEQQGRIFSKFFRGNNAIRMETDGSGLGLFISKNIIEAHGGKVWFESEDGKGTTFHFSFPVKEEFTEFLKKL